VRHTRVVGCFYYYVVVVAFQECSHRLWAEQVGVGDRFGVWVCFDEEEQRDTYAEQKVGSVQSAAGG
jgi:hypothetical protein